MFIDNETLLTVKMTETELCIIVSALMDWDCPSGEELAMVRSMVEVINDQLSAK